MSNKNELKKVRKLLNKIYKLQKLYMEIKGTPTTFPADPTRDRWISDIKKKYNFEELVRSS